MEIEITEESEDGGEITIRMVTGEKFVVRVLVDKKGILTLCLDEGSFDQDAMNSVQLHP